MYSFQKNNRWQPLDSPAYGQVDFSVPPPFYPHPPPPHLSPNNFNSFSNPSMHTDNRPQHRYPQRGRGNGPDRWSGNGPNQVSLTIYKLITNIN